MVFIPCYTYNSNISAAVLILDIGIVVNDNGILQHHFKHLLRTSPRTVVGSIGRFSPPLIRVPGIGQPDIAIRESQTTLISL